MLTTEGLPERREMADVNEGAGDVLCKEKAEEGGGEVGIVGEEGSGGADHGGVHASLFQG